MQFVESLILRGFLNDPEFTGSVLPYIKEEHFEEQANKDVYNFIREYVSKYEEVPSIEALVVCLEKTSFVEERYNHCLDTLEGLQSGLSEKSNRDWLKDQTLQHCKSRSAIEAVTKAIEIIDNGKEAEKNNIPRLLEEAISIDFNQSIGLDYFDDAEKQYDYYHESEDKIPFEISILNKITAGGCPRKTLNLFSAPINWGKSIWLSYLAGYYLSQGLNVAVFTMEMREEAYKERIDAYTMGCQVKELYEMSKSQYMNKTKQIRDKTNGQLVIKEFPAGTAHVGHFRHVLGELKLKKGINVDVVIVDYLTICSSQRMSFSAAGNSNTYYTEVAKEFHSLAKAEDIILWSAIQNGRQAQTASDVDLDDIALAIGIAATADFMLAAIPDEELEDQLKCHMKQLKNRYASKSEPRKFITGLDRSRMKFYEVDESGMTEADTAGAGTAPAFDQKKSETKKVQKSPSDWDF